MEQFEVIAASLLDRLMPSCSLRPWHPEQWVSNSSDFNEKIEQPFIKSSKKAHFPMLNHPAWLSLWLTRFSCHSPCHSIPALLIFYCLAHYCFILCWFSCVTATEVKLRERCACIQHQTWYSLWWFLSVGLDPFSGWDCERNNRQKIHLAQAYIWTLIQAEMQHWQL